MTSDYIVSVIIPAYNAEPYLKRCLDSICSQSLREIEIIVVDDGSTDKTYEIACSYASQDDRVKAYTQKNSYAGVARNTGMKYATGEYLSFLDADDFFDANMLEKLVGNARAYDSDVVICRSFSFDDNDEKITPMNESTHYLEPGTVYSPSELYDHMFEYTVGWAWDKLFKHEFVKIHNLAFQDIRSTNDAYFVYIALALAQRISYLDDYLVYHRVGNANSIENTRSLSWQNAFIAAQAIEQRLIEEGLFQYYERSYLRWLVSFSYWNLCTLHGEAKSGVFDSILENVIPRVLREEKDPLMEAYYYDYIDLSAKTHAELLHDCINDYWANSELKETIGILDSQANRYGTTILKLVPTLSNELVRLTKEIEKTNLDYQTSVSYRIGRFITYIPRTLKTFYNERLAKQG
ncbi:MAG: glycosyltransferase [Coriobacteriia bacterium]|nr:glycosyltransferase [Coriobacteriia bacterium]